MSSFLIASSYKESTRGRLNVRTSIYNVRDKEHKAHHERERSGSGWSRIDLKHKKIQKICFLREILKEN